MEWNDVINLHNFVPEQYLLYLDTIKYNQYKDFLYELCIILEWLFFNYFREPDEKSWIYTEYLRSRYEKRKIVSSWPSAQMLIRQQRMRHEFVDFKKRSTLKPQPPRYERNSVVVTSADLVAPVVPEAVLPDNVSYSSIRNNPFLNIFVTIFSNHSRI